MLWIHNIGTTALMQISSITANTLLNNILSYWKLDNSGSGSLSLIDSTGNGNTLTNSGATLGTGKINGAVVTGPSQSLATSTSFTPTGNNPFSISAWINLSTDYTFMVFSYGSPSTASAVALYVPTSLRLNFQFWNVGFGDIPVTANVWNHVVCTYDGTTARIYVNGSLSDSSVINLNIGSGIFRFNRWVNGSTGTGTCSVDEVGVWSRALSLSEITTLYNSGNGRSYPFTALGESILAYYRLDNNGSGGLSLIDSSNNGYTLTNINNVTLGTGKINGDATFSSTNYLSGNIPSIGSSPFTYSFWHKEPNDSSQFGLFGPNQWGGRGTTGGGTYSWGIYRDTGFQNINLLWSRFGTSLDNRMTTNLRFDDGNWHHYVIVYDGTNAILYVDGTNRYQAAVGFTPYSGAAIPLNIGATNGQTEAAEIDEVGIWTRALTPSEVTALYNSGNGRTYPF